VLSFVLHLRLHDRKENQLGFCEGRV